MSETTKGPASYFPAIEAKYGHPITHWQHLLREHRTQHPDIKHLQQVAWLKDEHGMGHGHANALVAATRAETNTPDCFEALGSVTGAGRTSRSSR